MKKICCVILSRANYGSIKSLMSEIKKNSSFKLQIITGASAVLKKFGDVDRIIRKDKFKISYSLDFQNMNLNLNSMSKTVGLGVIEISNCLKKLKPDYVVSVGDRYETMATALSAVYLNIPLIHTMGGERTGSLDESIRHAISKLSHLHFVSNADSKKRLIKMGEDSKFVFNVGCPRIDIVKKTISSYSKKNFYDNLNSLGVGCSIKNGEDIIVVSQHPVTSEYFEAKKNFEATFDAIRKFIPRYKIVYIWPNSDPGTEQISSYVRKFREITKSNNFRFIVNMPSETYYKLLNECSVLVGNSSSGVREGSFIGVPAVNIGTRQNERLHGKNIITVKQYNKFEIHKAICKQLSSRKKLNSKLYGNGDAAKKIVKILKKIKIPKIQKLNAF